MRGLNVGPLRVIENGLHAGERIVVNGLQRVRPGDVVAPSQVSMDTAPGAVKTGGGGAALNKAGFP